MKKKQSVVLFDYDGTLSARDANTEFWKYCFRHSARPWIFLPVIAVGFVVKFFAWIMHLFVPRTTVLRIDLWWRGLIRMFISGSLVKRLVPGFTREHSQNQFGWAAEQVAKERAAGHVVALTSAGPDYLILPLVANFGFDYIIASATDKKRPWLIDFFNYGDNKVLSASPFGRTGKIVRAYSDNASDAPMMALAAAQVWIDPKTGLRKGD